MFFFRFLLFRSLIQLVQIYFCFPHQKSLHAMFEIDRFTISANRSIIASFFIDWNVINYRISRFKKHKKKRQNEVFGGIVSVFSCVLCLYSVFFLSVNTYVNNFPNIVGFIWFDQWCDHTKCGRCTLWNIQKTSVEVIHSCHWRHSQIFGHCLIRKENLKYEILNFKFMIHQIAQIVLKNVSIIFFTHFTFE